MQLNRNGIRVQVAGFAWQWAGVAYYNRLSSNAFFGMFGISWRRVAGVDSTVTGESRAGNTCPQNQVRSLSAYSAPITKQQPIVTPAGMQTVSSLTLTTDPFIKEDLGNKQPLYAALVPAEIFKGSHFERRFVTPFGKVWEKLAAVIGEKGTGFAENDHAIHGLIPRKRLQRIQESLNALEHTKGTQDASVIVSPPYRRALGIVENTRRSEA